MTIPALTNAPDAPLRSEAPATFTAKAEAFVDWQGDFPVEMNAVIAAINALSFSTNSWKGAARLKTTANHGLSGLSAVDAVTPVAGDRILVGSNTDASENGIYIAASGAWSRAVDMDDDSEVLGSVVFVYAGTANSGKIFYTSNTSAVTVGTDDLTFAEYSSGGGGSNQTWDANFNDEGEVYILASEAMTITQQAVTGTGTVGYEKSTNAAPNTFSSTTSPITLEAGAKLKVTTTSVTPTYAVHLERTA